MILIIILAAAFALGYGAYRIIRGGFRAPQTEKLNVFGIVGYLIMVVLAAWLVTVLADRLF